MKNVRNVCGYLATVIGLALPARLRAGRLLAGLPQLM